MTKLFCWRLNDSPAGKFFELVALKKVFLRSLKDYLSPKEKFSDNSTSKFNIT